MDLLALLAKVSAIVKAGNERKPDRKRPQTQWFSVVAKDAASADLAIYNEIGFWGTTAADFKNALDAVSNVKTLNISINSPGGDVFDGFAIFNLLRAHKAEKIVTVDGLAASIASVIAMAGDKVKMPTASRMMIHNPWVGAVGDSAYLRDMADLLDELKSTMVAVYKSHAAALSDGDIADMMDKTTWMGAEKAKEKGFIDEVIENLPVKNSVSFGALANVPEEIMAHFKGATSPVIPAAAEPVIDKLKIQPSQKESRMDEEQRKAAEAKALADAKKAQDEAVAKAKAEFVQTQKSINSTAKALGFTDNDKITEILGKVVEGKITEAQAKDEIIVAHTDKMKSVPAKVTPGTDSADKFRTAAVMALAHNAGLPVSKEDLAEIPKTGLGDMGLQSFAKEILVRAGASNVHRLQGDALYAALCNLPRAEGISQGSSDFAYILENTMNKALTAGFTEVATTWQDVCGRTSVNDFRASNLVRLSAFSDMEEIPEGANANYGRLTDKKETVTVKTYGKAWSLTRQAIINDDLGAFTQGPRLMGASAKRKIETLWIDLLTSATFAGPTMTEDSIAFFDASTHGNYLASAGAAPSVSTISAGELAMLTRTALAPGDKKSGSIYSGVAPAIIFVPSAIKVATEQVVYSAYDPAASTLNKFNPYTSLRVISSPYLNAKSTTRWYLFANPTIYPAFVVAFLRGQETPIARSHVGDVGEPLGIVWDTYFDAAIGAQEWRHAYQSKGAS